MYKAMYKAICTLTQAQYQQCLKYGSDVKPIGNRWPTGAQAKSEWQYSMQGEMVYLRKGYSYEKDHFFLTPGNDQIFPADLATDW